MKTAAIFGVAGVALAIAAIVVAVTWRSTYAAQAYIMASLAFACSGISGGLVVFEFVDRADNRDPHR